VIGPRLRLVLLALALATCAAVLAATGSLDSGAVRDRIEGLGVAAPIAFVVVSALLTVVMFPGPLLAGASGLLFGAALGTPLSITAATLGACVAFCLSRWWAHDAVEELAGPRLRAARTWIGDRGFLSVLYARLVPGLPYGLVNYAFGMTPVRLTAFAAGTALGAAPRAFAWTALGGSLDDLTSPAAIAALGVLVMFALAGIPLARRALRREPQPAGGMGGHRFTGFRAGKRDTMAKDHGPSVKNDKQYEGLRKKGMSKERAAKIANTPNASSKGGKNSGGGGRKKSG
jgi:uncharacterized membrane protein YdjX (TVP38/TMEM64 family)